MMTRRSAKKILGNVGGCVVLLTAFVVMAFGPEQVDGFLHIHTPWLNTVLGVVLGLGLIALIAKRVRSNRRRKQVQDKR
jgi:uncharacterized membrane protein YccC